MKQRSTGVSLKKESSDFDHSAKAIYQQELLDAPFRELIEKCSAGLSVIDMDGTIQFINGAAEILLGREAVDLLGQPFPLPISANKTTELKIPRQKKDGALAESRIVEIHTSEIEWNKKPAYLVTLIDITDLERIERLKAEIIERQRIDRLKDEFISTVSHELRTPLTIVKGAIDNLKDGIAGPLMEKQAKVIQISHNNINRLVKIINDLLDLSRLESGRTQINRHEVHTISILQETVQNFQLQADQKNITLTSLFEDAIPNIFADPDLLTQVLTNLMDNALRYAKSTIKLKASVTESALKEEPLNFVQISVMDDGPGISSDKVGILFNKFVQLNRPSGGAGYKGTGLGLAICKEIIKKHQGKIWVKGSKDVGTEFCFVLPQYDKTTGFWTALRKALNEAGDKKNPMSVLALSVVNMKEIEKQRSPSEVNQLMQIIEERIQHQIFRKSDSIFRTTPKDFIIILSETNADQAKAVTRRIEEDVEISFGPVSIGTILPTLGVGIATFPQDGTEAEQLVNSALNQAENDMSR